MKQARAAQLCMAQCSSEARGHSPREGCRLWVPRRMGAGPGLRPRFSDFPLCLSCAIFVLRLLWLHRPSQELVRPMTILQGWIAPCSLGAPLGGNSNSSFSRSRATAVSAPDPGLRSKSLGTLALRPWHLSTCPHGWETGAEWSRGLGVGGQCLSGFLPTPGDILLLPWRLGEAGAATPGCC